MRNLWREVIKSRVYTSNRMLLFFRSDICSCSFRTRVTFIYKSRYQNIFKWCIRCLSLLSETMTLCSDFFPLLSYTFRDQMWMRRLKSMAILLPMLLFFGCKYGYFFSCRIIWFISIFDCPCCYPYISIDIRRNAVAYRIDTSTKGRKRGKKNFGRLFGSNWFNFRFQPHYIIHLSRAI